MNTDELRKASTAVSLATDEGVTRDLSIKLRWAADEIDNLREKITNTAPRSDSEGSEGSEGRCTHDYVEVSAYACTRCGKIRR